MEDALWAEFKMGGIDIALSANEYLMPMPAGGDYLLIRDSESNALISLRLQSIGADEMRLLAKKDCEIEGCPRVDERLSDVDHVKIVLLTYPKKAPDEPMLQQHLLVEGSNVWGQYIGPSDRYQSHKETLDKLARALAAKVAAGKSLSTNR